MGFNEIEEARASLDRLVNEAMSGDEVVLTRHGRPLVGLVPCGGRLARRLGTAAGEVTVEPLAGFDGYR